MKKKCTKKVKALLLAHRYLGLSREKVMEVGNISRSSFFRYKKQYFG